MKTESLLIIGAIGLGAYFLLGKGGAEGGGGGQPLNIIPGTVGTGANSPSGSGGGNSGASGENNYPITSGLNFGGGETVKITGSQIAQVAGSPKAFHVVAGGVPRNVSAAPNFTVDPNALAAYSSKKQMSISPQSFAGLLFQ